MDDQKDETYKIPNENLPALDAAIAKLNKKADKLGCFPVSYDVTGTVKEEIKDDKGEVIGYRLYSLVAIDGEAPKIPGWSFEGIVAFSDPAVDGFILRMAPSAEDLDRSFRAGITADPRRCDHCGTQRNRRETFVVRSDDGLYHLVGRTCLKDFTGHSNPQAIASYFTMLDDLLVALGDDETGFGACGYVAPLLEILGFMAVVVALARLDGFMSKRESLARYDNPVPTASTAWELCSPWSKEGKKESKRFHEEELTDADSAKAEKIIAFLPTMWAQDEDELSDFILNLRNSVSTDLVSGRTSGIVAAGYVCYEREMNDKAREKLGDKLRGSEHQGQPKQRLTLELTVHSVRFIEGPYGSTALTKLHDADFNSYCWFNSGSTELEVNETYRLKGTVKKHDSYNGINETHLSRCKVL